MEGTKAVAYGALFALILGTGCAAFDGSPKTEAEYEQFAQKNHIANAAGGLHSLALRSDGSIFGWGDKFL